MSAEILHTCPSCGRGNFTERGLRTHRCERRPDRPSGSSLPAPISPLPAMSKAHPKAPLSPAVIEIEPAPGAVQVDPWAKARRLVEAATLFQRASLAAQILAGLELLTLHKTWGVKRGGDRKSGSKPHDVALIGGEGAKPHGVALIPKWSDAVKKHLGISDQTAARWMEMAKAAKPRLSKSDLDLGSILEKNPGALTPAEQELLKKAVHKISDGRTQMEFLLECGVTKASQGSGAKGGNTRGGGAGGDNNDGEAGEPAVPADGWEPRAKGLNNLLVEALGDNPWNECNEAERRILHGNLIDAAKAVAATLKPKA